MKIIPVVNHYPGEIDTGNNECDTPDAFPEEG
jgi:hypothetical protein